MESDRERGSGFAYVMSAGIGLAVALGIQLLAFSMWFAIAAGVTTGITGMVFVARAA